MKDLQLFYRVFERKPVMATLHPITLGDGPPVLILSFFTLKKTVQAATPCGANTHIVSKFLFIINFPREVFFHSNF